MPEGGGGGAWQRTTKSGRIIGRSSSGVRIDSRQ
jgi:hypothetical protein